MRKWRETHPLSAKQRKRHNVRALARVYKKRGKLIPEPCQVCGATEKIEMHHEDYAKPLDVQWMCRPCHVKQTVEAF